MSLYKNGLLCGIGAAFCINHINQACSYVLTSIFILLNPHCANILNIKLQMTVFIQIHVMPISFKTFYIEKELKIAMFPPW